MYVEFQKNISYYYGKYVPNDFLCLVIINTFITYMYKYMYVF